MQTNLNLVQRAIKEALNTFAVHKTTGHLDEGEEYMIRFTFNGQPVKCPDPNSFEYKISCFHNEYTVRVEGTDDFYLNHKRKLPTPLPEAVADKIGETLGEFGHPAHTNQKVQHFKPKNGFYPIWTMNLRFPTPYGPLAAGVVADKVNRAYADADVSAREGASNISIQQAWFWRRGELVVMPHRKKHRMGYLVATIRWPSGIGGYLVLDGVKVIRCTRLEKYTHDAKETL